MKQRQIRKIWVLQPERRLLGDEETDVLEAALCALHERGEYRIVIDLSKIEIFNSTGIGLLVEWHVRLLNLNGCLALGLVPARMLDFFRRTKLDQAFNIRTGLVDAVWKVEGFSQATTAA